MKKIGMAKDKRLDVFKVVAAVVHIGNIEIIESDSGGAEVTPAAMQSVKNAGGLLGLAESDLIDAITTRATKIPGEAKLGCPRYFPVIFFTSKVLHFYSKIVAIF